MLRSRMLTPGFKLYFGIALFGLFGALVFGVNTELQSASLTVRDNLDEQGVIAVFTGPLTVGWKGAIGNHMGYAIWLTMALVAGFLAFLLIAFRDADPEAVAQVAHTESVPLTRAPAGASYMPVLGAFALAVIAIGWIVNRGVFYAGLALLAAVVGTWTIRAWADRATGDDAINRQIYQRIIDPLRVPIVGAFLIAFVVLGISRVLLAVPNKTASSVIFGLAAVVFFVLVVGIALVPRLSRSVMVVLLVIGGLAVLAGGIYGIAAGPREMEHHGTEHTEGAVTEGHSDEGTGTGTGSEPERRRPRQERRTDADRPPYPPNDTRSPLEGDPPVKRGNLGLKIFGLVVGLVVTAMFGLMTYDAIKGNEGKPLTTLTPQGPSAQTIQNLAIPVFAIAGIVFIGVPAVIIYICWRYRDTGDEATADDVPAQLHGKTWAEITWTAIPALVLLVVAVLTVGTIRDLEARTPDAMQVKVEGQQWWWQFRYDMSNDGAGNGSWDDPEDIVTANELVVPVGRQIALTQTSNDVIHSFWIPALNGKKDAVPGMDTHWSLQADTVGVYRGQCTEFCGLSHGNMRMLVRAIDSTTFFGDWVPNQQKPALEPTDDVAKAGKEVFTAQLCSSCHLIRGVNDDKVANPETGVETQLVSGVAPDLTHFATRGTFAGSIFNSHYPNPASAENTPFGTTCVLAKDDNPGDLPICPPANQKDSSDTVFATAPGNPDNPTNPVALADWLRDPPKIKPMAPDPEPQADERRRGMPNLKLTEEQISQLVAYLNSLK